MPTYIMYIGLYIDLYRLCTHTLSSFSVFTYKHEV